MRLELNRHDTTPLYRQLTAQLRERIVAGTLAEGYRLPPERELAARLGVNRATVLQAYQRLKDEGLIASRVGHGTFVLPAEDDGGRAVPQHELPPDARGAQAVRDPWEARDARGPRELAPSVARPPWAILFSDYANRFTYHDIAEADRAQRGGSPAGGGSVIDFAAGSPNPDDIPDDLLRAVSLEAFSSHEFDGQPESPIEGFAELRALLADHMRTRGVACEARDVMVLSGSEQGIDLCVRAFLNPGDRVLVEQSTYFPALQAFRSAGAQVVGVPVDEHGMRTDLLDGYCARYHPKFIYTIPTFHNPTGTTMPLARRRELVAAARRHQCLIIEDDAYGELSYGKPPGDAVSGPDAGSTNGPAIGLPDEADARPAVGLPGGPADDGVRGGSGVTGVTGDVADVPSPADAERPVPLRGMEDAGYVIYLSTFSKTVTSGLRTGWMVADPHVIGRLAALRRMVDQHTSASSQRICLELVKRGRIDGHIRALRGAYRRRRDLAVAALERYAPDGMRWVVPEGGYYLWVALPDGVRSLDLLAACRDHGVTFMPGAVFDVDEDDTHLRLNLVRPAVHDLDRGIRIICDTVRSRL